jgi:hypothetical protein
MYILFIIQYFTTSIIFSIINSEAKISKYDVHLLLIKHNDFFHANLNNFTFYTEMLEKSKFKFLCLLTVCIVAVSICGALYL